MQDRIDRNRAHVLRVLFPVSDAASFATGQERLEIHGFDCRRPDGRRLLLFRRPVKEVLTSHRAEPNRAEDHRPMGALYCGRRNRLISRVVDAAIVRPVRLL
jgi:hypothetical protein